MYETRLIHVSIGRDWREVYDFARKPENFSQWAAGLGSSLRQKDGVWVADTPQGQVQVRFSAANEFGILDHYVTLPTGQEIYIPIRVIANDNGAEVIFTLYRLPEMDDAAFERDAQLVQKDLNTLKELLQ